jgi:hypothetical protein
VKYWFSGANWGDQLADVISSLMVYVTVCKSANNDDADY